MRKFSFLVAVVSLGGASALATACSHGDDVQAGSADLSSATPCTVVAVKDGHVMTASEIGALGDPVANLILTGEGCPSTFGDIQAKLARTDPCDAPAPGAPHNNGGVFTNLVTNRAQLLGRPDTYRAVVRRICQNRSDHELLMSISGISVDTDGAGHVTATHVPQTSVELIGQQKTVNGGETSGVFNFYAREDDQWKFFGSSADLVAEGYECNADGACIPKAATKQRCASCHVGGGLVMKELDTPWVNWDHGGRLERTPGAAEVIAQNPTLFGKDALAVDLESAVMLGNEEWIPKRIEVLEGLGLKEVLRPLFCATDMNLQSGETPKDPQDSSLFADAALVFPVGGGPIPFNLEPIDQDTYRRAIEAAGQRIVDARTGTTLVGADGKPVRDVLVGFTYPVRSVQDEDYVQALQDRGIVDVDFVRDVLSIDFTRPLYSPTRCKLLELAPDVPVAEMGPDRIKAAWVERLEGTTDRVAAQLLANLKNPADADEHQRTLVSFVKACDGRERSDRAGYWNDILRYASRVRRAARRARNATNGGIIEFPETLPVDDLPEVTVGLAPTTCKLP